MRHCLLSLTLVCLAISGVSDATAECFSSQQPIFRNTSNRAGPIAWTGSFLAMAALNTSTSNGIDFVRFGSNLEPADTRRVVDSSPEGAFALVWTGTEFGLFYQDAERFEVLQRLSSTGEKIGSPIRLLPAPTGTRQTYDVEWNGTRYVIARTNLSRTQDRGLYITVVNADGSIFINQAIGSSASDKTDLDVATAGDRLALVWTSVSNTGQATSYFSYLAPGSSFISTVHLAMTGDTPRIVWDGTSFVVVTSRPLTGGGATFHAARLDPAGVLIAPAVQLFTSSGQGAVADRLIWTGQMFGLSYLDSPSAFLSDHGEFRLHTFLPNLTTRSDVRFDLSSADRFAQSYFPLVWTGESFVATLQRIGSATRENETVLISQCPLFVEIAIGGDLVVDVPTRFTARITGGVPPYRIRWDFGDRTTSNEAVVEKIYRRTGDFVVTLTVTDTVGEEFRIQRSITVLARAPQVTTLEFTPGSPSVGEQVRFAARVSGGVSPHRFSWNFGDGATATGASATHAFSVAGSFLVTLSVTDDYGATVTLTRTVNVSVPPVRRRGVRR